MYVLKSIRALYYKYYKTEYLDESDPLTVSVKLNLNENKMRGYWKLNTT